MKDNKSSESSITRGKQWGLASAIMALIVALSCASVRLDPEHNQALTFDTVPANDAGVLPSAAPNLPVKASASQLAPDDVQGGPSSADAGVRGEPLTCTVDPPDPKPSHTRDWLIYEFNYKEGSVSVGSQKRETTPKPRDTARLVGRYAVELWIGCELVDRVRFGFPLQAAEQPKAPSARHPIHEQPSLTQNAQLTTAVRIPLDPRATRAELVDRGTGRRSALAWPPNLSEAKAPKTEVDPLNSPNIVPAKGSHAGDGPR
jgi:hypothetical protein